MKDKLISGWQKFSKNPLGALVITIGGCFVVGVIARVCWYLLLAGWNAFNL